MKFKSLNIILTMLVVVMLAFFSCSKDDAEIAQLTVPTTDISFLPEGGSSDLSFTTNDSWTLLNGATWLHLSQGTGEAGENTITLTADDNPTGFSRKVVINLETKNGKARRITVTQTGNLYPSFNLTPKPADMTGMSSTATELFAKMILGVNFGNTMELTGIMPDPTEANVKFLKQLGFNMVRLPCSFNYRGGAKDSPTSKISDDYLDKVKQIVQWCVENDMYVMVNIHWDGGWLESKKIDDVDTNNYNPNSSRKEIVNAKQKALWEQIATKLRDFDEHLFFASSNEPNAETADEMKVLLSYHKSFITAVRSTGGRNTYRTLVLQGHEDYISPADFAALNDPTPNRLAYEWHNYTPSSMTILGSDRADGGWDNVRFYWGAGNHVAGLEKGIDRNCSYGEEDELIAHYNAIKTKWVDKGIPCLMGEFSSNRWTATSKFQPEDLDKHNKSVDDWYTFQVKHSKATGSVPCLWETGGLYNRATNVIKDQRAYDAIKAGLN